MTLFSVVLQADQEQMIHPVILCHLRCHRVLTQRFKKIEHVDADDYVRYPHFHLTSKVKKYNQLTKYSVKFQICSTKVHIVG